ncbi:MAG: hypothetical protein FJX56_12320 [Alphaproteobacteria bacterium]|nr:hypothetical protein [Alphaproteobacteria bacterium]
MTLHNNIYAAPEYLERYGTPRGPEDLANHRLLVYGEDIRGPVDLNWLLRIGSGERSRRRPTLKLNSLYGLMRAAESGLGLAGLPDYVASGSPRLVRALDTVSGPVFEAYFVYPEELRNSKRIGVFRDFLVSRVGEFPRSAGYAV